MATARYLPLKPKVTNAAPVMWEVFEGGEAVEMVNRQVSDTLRRRKPNIDRHSAAAILLQTQTPPSEDTAADWAEKDFK